MHYLKESIIIILLISIVAGTAYFQNEIQQHKNQATELQKQIEQKNTQLLARQETKQAEQQAPKQIIIEKEITQEIKTSYMPVLAYNRATRQGVVGYVEVSLVPGKGDTLIDVRPFNSPTVQKSAQNAVMAALKEAGMRQLGYKDVKIKFYIDSEAVGGESAGIAIALATLALLTDKETKEYVAATGTIDRDGTIGKVGGILQKAEAASKKNTRVLLIPRGEGEITAITPHYFIDPETGKRVGKGEPIERKINVIKEARSRWNLEVQQVATLSEAKKYVFK